MAHCNTVLSQILRIFPRHEFQTLADKYHAGQKFRSFSRWTQFVALMTAQLTGRDSLRDIVENMSAQTGKLFFKWIKQNLKVKSFLRTSRNAVMTQLWIALCAAGIPEVPVESRELYATDVAIITVKSV